MKIEIIKEYHRENGSVEEKYSIKTTYFKFLTWFKTKDELDDGLIITLILYHLFILAPLIILGIIFNFYLVIGGVILELIFLKIVNYYTRELYEDLGDVEYDVKDLIKLNSLNKKIIQRYTIENNHLIIEKEKEK